MTTSTTSPADLSPAMLSVLADLRDGKEPDGRSWRATTALERRGLIGVPCRHPLSCLRCQASGVACGAHIRKFSPGHDRCTGDEGRFVLTPAGEEALRLRMVIGGVQR